jgi:hydroxyacylglutathione hydrolase
MKIKRFEVPGLAQYSYIVSDAGQAVVVDPIRDIDRYVDYLASNHLTLVHVLETHIHADFASGSTALAAATGAALTLSAHDDGQHYRYTMPHRPLRDADAIAIGSVRIEALHTPGHTPEHLSFLVFDTTRSTTIPIALLSGDFLFVGSMGRPDLLGEAAKQGLAHDLFHSLHHRIAALPDGLAIYPGHGAGSLCGAGMSERAESTLGYERATNPLFQLDEQTFVAEILASVPPMPVYYPRMKELNSHGAPLLQPTPGSTPLTPSQVSELTHQADVLLLDLRRAEAFGGAHIPGAINIGAGFNLALWAGWLLQANQRIILINDTGDDLDTRLSLTRVGLDHTLGFLAGGMPAWLDAGLPTGTTQQVSPDAVQLRSGPSTIIDVRSDSEWNSEHIHGAKHIMLGDLAAQVGLLSPSTPILAVCGSGYRSSIAASLLARAGISGVASMSGGMAAWNRRRLPTVR